MIKIKSKDWVIGTLIFCIITLIALVLIKRPGQTSGSVSRLKIAHVDLDEALKNRPDWKKYLQLKEELGKLEQEWAVKTGEKPVGNDKPDLGQYELKQQTGEINKIFNEEINAKSKDLNKAMEEYSKSSQSQTNTLFKTKVAGLNDQLENELKTKSEETNQKLEAYRNHIQSENQVILSNLQLQLSTIDLSLSAKESKDQKDKIQNQIEQIKEEMNIKIRAEAKRLQDEFDQFAKGRKADISKQIDAYKNDLEQKLRNDLLNYRKGLDSQFERWRQKRAQEMNSAIKSRQDQTSQQYSKYSSEKLVLEAQLQQAKETAFWQLKKSVKRLALMKKIDLVVSGDLAGLKQFDLTNELKKAMNP